MGEQLRRAFEDFLDAESAVRIQCSSCWRICTGATWQRCASLTAALRNLHDRPFLVHRARAARCGGALFPKLWEQRRMQEIRLRPLSRKASERLVTQVLGQSRRARTAAARIAARGRRQCLLPGRAHPRGGRGEVDRGEASDIGAARHGARHGAGPNRAPLARRCAALATRSERVRRRCSGRAGSRGAPG